MKLKNIKITVKKELRTILRDKKTLLVLLVFPFIIPLMILFYSTMSNMEAKNYTVGIDYKLNEIEKSILKNVNLDIKNYSSIKELRKAYDNKDISGYIDYNNDTNMYTVYVDDSEDGLAIREYANSYLSEYKQEMANNYFSEQGVDLKHAYSIVTYNFKNLEGDNYFLKLIFSMIFIYIIMSIIISASNVAISATAVEKENGTLETILTFPVSSSELVIGKYISTVIMGFITSVMGLIFAVVTLSISTNYFDSMKLLNFNISPSTILLSLVIILAASIFIGGLAIVLTSKAKNYKEATSSSQVLTFISIIPIFVSAMGITINNYYYLIPIANFIQILMDIFTHNITLIHILTVFVSSIVYVAIVIRFIINQYKSEKVLFNE